MERSCRLTNTTYSDVSASLPLPSLPVSCGAADSSVRIADESSVAGADVVAHARPIAEFLDKCDVSYLDLKDASGVGECLDDSSWLYNEVLKYNSKAFDLSSRGFAKEKRHHNPTSEKKYIDENTIVCQTKLFQVGDFNDQLERDVYTTRSTGLKKLKANKKKKDVSLSTDDVNHYQDIIRSFNNLVGDICGRVEVLDDDQEGENQSSLTLSDIRKLTNEILSIRTRKVLQLVPVDVLSRLLSVLDHQILCGQGLTIDDNSDAVVLISCALESICAALAIMTHQDIPKQLYKEEIIERILDFTKRQIMDMMAACDPCYRAIHRPKQNGCRFDGADDDDEEEDFGSGGNKRKRNFKTKKSSGSGNRVSSTVHNVIQKLCSILVNLKDLLRIVKLSDSCILQMAKMTFSTFLAENMELLQLKAIGLICGVYASYTQHRNFLVDETVQLLWKLPVSKRALRRYHLPDEEQKQIQMVSALLIQLVQCSADLPEVIKSKLSFNSFSDASLDATDPIKLQKSATETCCQFWRCVVERFTTSKPQDVSESKMIIENIVADLLTTLNLPEYPASALILEVLCVLLLENTGLKSKDMAARGATIDLLGTIAARLKCDNVSCNMNKFWITEEISENKDVNSHPTDKCCICFREKSLTISSVICSVCQRYFHAECVGVAVDDNLFRDWSCHVCTCKKQLLVLHSYCKPQIKTNIKNSMGTGDSTSVSRLEIVQQILLNYLQETSSDDDIQLFNRWFYLCLWYKDDPLSQDRAIYYFSRLKSKTILRDFGAALFLPREWAKKICLALGQDNSFSRGFDNILSLLLASLRENSPMLRTKALHAVSSIVEADPEVLCDKRVQCAVEGRFCDSSISVRQAALELVGRYIASHPDVGLKYFEKVAERIKDTGVSVRKRAIKIIRDMCMSNAGLNGFSDVTSAFIEIISRIGDEESSIQDLVCKTFFEFWFEETSSCHTQFASDGSSVPLEIAKKTEQIVDLFRKMPNRHFLIIVIKRNLALDFLPQAAKASGISVSSLASVRKRCQLMCSHLLERILQVEEANDDSDEVHALPYVLAVQAFCMVDPTLCAPSTDPSQFVVTLQPYLKNKVDNRSVAHLHENIISVIDAVLPMLRKPPQLVLEELEQDLKHMVVRHSYLTVVHACIKCLCSLGKITGKGATLVEYLIRVFFKQLQGSTVDNKQQLGRSLFCLGLLVRYGDDLILSSGNKNSYVAKSLHLVKNYLLAEDFGLKARSLQALGNILIARPEYMLEKDIRKILVASLSSDSDARLKMQALQNLLEYLFDVELQMDIESKNTASNHHRQDMGNKVSVAAGAGDTNTWGGIIQLYWDNILENCLDGSHHVRHSSLKIVEIVLRQGLVHPITCVPHLVALETDPQEVISKLAHHLLMNMNEKYPSIFESRLGDGLQMSFRFFQSIVSTHNVTSGNVKGRSFGSAFACVRPGICRIYRIIRANRMSRNKFLHSIIRKFEPGCWKFSSLPFLLYCTEIIASLPFTSPDEPLYLVYAINRILQVRVGPIESNMKMWYSNFLQGNSAESYIGSGREYKSVQHIFNQDEIVTSPVISVSFGISNENMQSFQSDCQDALALQLLLKLKRYLKIAYSLSDARCQAYSPKDHQKFEETLSKHNVPFNISDTSLTLPKSYEDMVVFFKELKQLLKDDTLDYTTYTSSIKRKRPTPKSSKKRAQPVRGENDDDGENDSEWIGGARKLDFSGQNSGGRVTRQRYNSNQMT